MIEIVFQPPPCTPRMYALLREEVAPGVFVSASGDGDTCLGAIHNALEKCLLARPHIWRAFMWKLKRQTITARKEAHRTRVRGVVEARRAAA